MEIPFKNIEKMKKEKIESSTRFKSYEYAKLIKPKPRTTNDFDANYKDIGIIGKLDLNNLNEVTSVTSGSNVNQTPNRRLRSINEKEKEDNIKFNMMLNSQKDNNNINKIKINENYVDSPRKSERSIIHRYGGTENENELVKLQKQRENYNLKINEIKESLLK